MAAGKYSAGTIFLQVVPVFRDTMDQISEHSKRLNKALGDDAENAGREAGARAGKAMGEEMEKTASKSSKKAGEKAGEEYAGAFESRVKSAISSAQKEVDRLNFSTASQKSIDDLDRVKRKLKELKDIDYTADFDSKKVLAQVALIEGALTALSKQDHEVNISANLQKALADIEVIRKAADKVEEKRRELNFVAKPDFKAAERQIGAFEKKFRSQMKRAADSLGDGLGPAIAKARAELNALSDVEIGIDMQAEEAVAKARAVHAALEAATAGDVSVDVEVDAAAAMSHLAMFRAAAEDVDGKDIDVKVDVDGAAKAVVQLNALQAIMAAFRPRALGAASASENAANSFRSFNGVILAATVLIPSLIPMVGALGGGLLALIPVLGAVTAGLGVAILGFSGIGNAVTELGKVADEQKLASGKAEEGARSVAAATHAVADAERALADARRNAARAAADAERRVADARRNAARSIEAAYDRQKDAAEAYKDAQDAVREAEQDLRDARAEAEADAADLATRQRKNAVDERQAVLDLGQAQNDYNNIMADGASTNTDKEQASVNLEQAQIALNDVRNEQVELTKEAEDYAKNGVEGTEKVKTAQEQLLEALEAQKDAQEDVKEAAEETRQVQLDAARDVADALRAQKQVAADNARSVADAQRNLARAQEGAADAVTAAATESTAAMDRLETAMDKLSPAGQKFARFLFGLRSGFRETRDAVQEQMLPGIQTGLEMIIAEYGPRFKALATEVAGVWGDLGVEMGKGLTSPAWQSFFGTYAKIIPDITRDFGRAMGNWATALAGIFEAVAPYAADLSDIMLELSDRASKFFQSAKGKQEVKEFLEYAWKVGPDVVGFFKDLARFVGAVAKALAPIGDAVLKAFGGLFDFIANLNPKVLNAIITGVVGLVLAFQLAVGVVAIFFAGAAVFSSLAGAIVFAVVAIATVLFILWQNSETLRDIVKAVGHAVMASFKAIGDAAMTMWRDYIKPAIETYIIPALQKLWEAVKWLWTNVVKPYLKLLMAYWSLVFKAAAWTIKHVVMPVIKALWTYMKVLWKVWIKPILTLIWNYFKFAFKLIKGYWTHILWPVLHLLGTIIWKLWNLTVKPVLKFIWEQFQKVGAVFRDVWQQWIKPALEHLRDFINDHVKPKFEQAVNDIKGIWEGLKAAFAGPVKFMIEKVVNDGIIKGFNWVARKVGSDEMSPIPVPEWAQNYATGGILPGYTPGRDVHSFVSPTGGRLNLSGGEAIMRPEWTAAMGSGYVNEMNKIAANGGVSAIRKTMGFSLGGILPGGSLSSHGSMYGHPAYDINYPGYADYGKAIHAYAKGFVRAFDYGYDNSYGRGVVIDHGSYQTLYAHMSRIATDAIGKIVGEGTTVGYVGDYGNTGSPPTSHLHFEIGSGWNLPWTSSPGSSDGEYGPSGAPAKPQHLVPSWAKNILGAPLDWAKDLISKPINSLQAKFGSSEFPGMVVDTGKHLASLVGKKIGEYIPGKKAFDAAGKFIGGAADAVGDAVGGAVGGVGDALGLKTGGILPYNGTMKYDAGGYLPPGVTSVVNLTGRPEPVFTASQFDNMDFGGGGDGFTYAPTFQGSNLTAADVVDDLDFARRRIQREGRYGRSKG